MPTEYGERARERFEERRQQFRSKRERGGGVFGFGIIGTFGVLDRKKEQRRPVPMEELPDCDICKQQGKKTQAEWDCKTTLGPWAYLCYEHKLQYGASPCSKLEKRVKVAAPKSDKVPTVSMPIGCDDICEVTCPHCGEPRTVEPDANYVVECESCGNRYRVASWL